MAKNMVCRKRIYLFRDDGGRELGKEVFYVTTAQAASWQQRVTRECQDLPVKSN